MEINRRSFIDSTALAAAAIGTETLWPNCRERSNSDLGIRDTLIHNWRKAFEADRTLQAVVNQSPSVEAELKRLREENRQLKMERDILKKATAFFVKENG